MILRRVAETLLLRSVALRGQLADYYGRRLNEQRRLGFGEDDQDRFRAVTVGLLSGAQLAAIEDPAGYELEVAS